MRETDPLEIVNGYLAAIGRRDYQTARSHLADRGFRYMSPIARFDDADDFLGRMEGVGAILHQIKARKFFVNGMDVCHILDVTVAMADYSIRMAGGSAHTTPYGRSARGDRSGKPLASRGRVRAMLARLRYRCLPADRPRQVRRLSAEFSRKDSA